MIAALFVESHGVYSREGVDVWGVERDARTYSEAWPVVAHPPCERWGRYWFGGPSVKVRRALGDDDGCFASAIASVRRCGGVLEHPEGSHAFAAFGLPRPVEGVWSWAFDEAGGLVTSVEQGHFGHPARKKTWLYACRVSRGALPVLPVGASGASRRLDEGFHTAEERRAAREAGRMPIKRLSRLENKATPAAFADLLLGIARAVGS